MLLETKYRGHCCKVVEKLTQVFSTLVESKLVTSAFDIEKIFLNNAWKLRGSYFLLLIVKCEGSLKKVLLGKKKTELKYLKKFLA